MELICPHDGARLEGGENPQIYSCARCARTYPVRDGVVCLLEEQDTFYEGHYLNEVKFVPRSERLRHAWPLWLLLGGYVWQIRKHLRGGAAVLEIGSAAGIRYLGTRYRTTALDVSWQSLRRICADYEARVLGSCTGRLPFPDGSFDGVLSSFLWEHIAPEQKPAMLAECRRVLRPGGRLIFLYDVETRNPLIHVYRSKDPGSYQRVFLDGDGHLGYQTPEDNAAIFRRAGFAIRMHRGLERSPFVSPSTFEKLSHFNGAPQGAFRAGAAIQSSARLFYPYLAFQRVFDGSVGLALPRSWSRIMLTVAVAA